MFTGIVTEVGRVISRSPDKLMIEGPLTCEGLAIGGSVGVNGACLTVTHLDQPSFAVEIMPETLRRSNIGLLSPGARVNLELPLTINTPLGGHLVQGHVDSMGQVISLIIEGSATIMRIKPPGALMRYVVEKGFVAVDGVSLTVIAKSEGFFDVSLVKHTMLSTNLYERRSGDRVNLEVDIIAKYVEALMSHKDKGISLEYLREHGFLE